MFNSCVKQRSRCAATIDVADLEVSTKVAHHSPDFINIAVLKQSS